MWNKIRIAFASFALLGVVAGGVATAPASSAIPSPREIKVFARTTNFKVVGPGLNAGDVWLFRATVYNKKGKAAGVERGQCTLNFEKTGICTVSFYFIRKGLVLIQGPVPLDRQVPVWLAVVGGTGKYQNARGKAHFDFGRKTSRAVIKLLP